MTERYAALSLSFKTNLCSEEPSVLFKTAWFTAFIPAGQSVSCGLALTNVCVHHLQASGRTVSCPTTRR